ncbi:hypothetical protein E2C01_080365 [Portunus trituberculatus]|uniref:Secreted protein n=1 Tax=Portunus trituberculatus TaxID=210409 RepID=A0A5B7IT99_PORTR|nr:hypothetical protein [Portunus trituberculatus]
MMVKFFSLLAVSKGGVGWGAPRRAQRVVPPLFRLEQRQATAIQSASFHPTDVLHVSVFSSTEISVVIRCKIYRFFRISNGSDKLKTNIKILVCCLRN